MISNSTMEIINYSKQLDYEYNIKFLLIISLLVYAIILFYIDKKYLKTSTRASFKIFAVGSRAFYYSMLIYLPYLFYQLSLTENLYFLTSLYLWIYTAGAILLITGGAIFLLEKLLNDFLGWEITLNGFKIHAKKIPKI